MNEYIKACIELSDGNFKALEILKDIMGRNQSLDIYVYLRKEGLIGSKLVEYCEENKLNSFDLALSIQEILYNKRVKPVQSKLRRYI